MFQLRNDILQRTLTIVRQIHEYRHTSSKYDELLLNLFTHGLIFFFLVGESLLLLRSLFASFFLDCLRFIDDGLNILVQ